jgi:hypothetical protein
MGNETKIVDIVYENAVRLDMCDPGTVIEVETLNTLYTVEIINDRHCKVHGGSWFPEPTVTSITGAVWTGHEVEYKRIVIGKRLEIVHPGAETGSITVSKVKSLRITAPNKAWSYEMPEPDLLATERNPLAH